MSEVAIIGGGPAGASAAIAALQASSKVRLIEKPSGTSNGVLGWPGRKSAVVQKLQSTDLELHMERRDPAQSSRLTITLVMRPSGGLPTPEWRSRCGQLMCAPRRQAQELRPFASRVLGAARPAMPRRQRPTETRTDWPLA